MMDQNKIEVLGDQITKKKKTKLMVYNKMSELERKWELQHKNTIYNLFHQKIPNQKTCNSFPPKS